MTKVPCCICVPVCVWRTDLRLWVPADHFSDIHLRACTGQYCLLAVSFPAMS
jgi:hypothetical protein